MEKERYQPQRFSRLYPPLKDDEWEFPNWYKTLQTNQLLDLGYHKCKCNELIKLHRQTCSIYYCPGEN